MLDQHIATKNMATGDAPIKVDPATAQILKLPTMVNPGVYPKPIPFGGMGKPVNQNGFSDHHDQRGCPDLWRSGTRTTRTRISKACKPGSGWNVIKISAFDTPAYTGEKVPEELPPLLVSPTWLRTHANAGVWIRRCTSPRSMASFPEVSEKTLIPVSWITAAQERRLEPEG
jgi:hypothetical protein